MMSLAQVEEDLRKYQELLRNDPFASPEDSPSTAAAPFKRASLSPSPHAGGGRSREQGRDSPLYASTLLQGTHVDTHWMSESSDSESPAPAPSQRAKQQQQQMPEAIAVPTGIRAVAVAPSSSKQQHHAAPTAAESVDAAAAAGAKLSKEARDALVQKLIQDKRRREAAAAPPSPPPASRDRQQSPDSLGGDDDHRNTRHISKQPQLQRKPLQQPARPSSAPPRSRASSATRRVPAAAAAAPQAAVFPFKPKINQYHSQVTGPSRDIRIEMLARPKSVQWEERERVRRQQEEEAMRQLQSANVHRNVVKPSKHSGHASADVVPIEERLFHEADNRDAIRERARRYKEEQELSKTCTFKPNVEQTATVDNGSWRPIHERIGELQRQKVMLMQRLRSDTAGDTACTFQPNINSRSTQLVMSRSSSDPLDVSERLYRDHHELQARRQASAGQLGQASQDELRFEPSINTNSLRILNESERLRGKNFWDRQSEAIQEKEAKRRAAAADANDFSFAPVVNENSMILASAIDRANESFMDRVERLSFNDNVRQQQLRKGLAEEYYSQFTFQPQINKVSRALGRCSSVEELHDNPNGRAQKEHFQRLKAAAEKQVCTFKPDTTASQSGITEGVLDRSLNVRDAHTLHRRIEERQRLKEMKLDTQRRCKEVEEVKECTFTPDVLSGPALPAGPVIVKGMGRHLELKGLARQQQQELEERERRAFKLQVEEARSPYTVPTPFNLSEGKGKEAIGRSTKQLLQQQQKELTFHPHTNESRSKEILARILATE